MADKVVIFSGPRKAFDSLVAERTSPNDTSVRYLDAIRSYNKWVRASDMASAGPKNDVPTRVDNCIVHADDFGSVLSHAIDNFAGLLRETFDIGTLFIQNPPRRVIFSLRNEQDAGTIEEIEYKYTAVNKSMLPAVYKTLCDEVLGQNESKKALIASLYKLSVFRDTKPSVVLLYGPSGVGKTETALSLSRALGGELTRVQFSMMQTQEAYDYLFGAEHSKASFARDLLSRESNIVLIDEFDKVQPALYNMFFELFDDGKYVDTNYDVNMRDSLFVLTSNFKSEGEIRKRLGSAMFSRLGACIPFSDLTTDQKVTIIASHFERILNKLDDEDRKRIEDSGIQEWFISNASRYDNMRLLKNKIDKAIFENLADSIINGSSSGSPIS